MTQRERDAFFFVLWLLLVSFCITVLVWGCGGGGSDHTDGGQGTLKRAPMLLGYSLPNGWHLADPAPFAKAMHNAGLTGTEIEWFPYINSPTQPCGRGNTTNTAYPSLAHGFIDTMCQAGVTTYVNLVNANSCAQTNQDDVWFQHELDRALAVLDPACVILGGVSEPWAADQNKMHRWEHMARASWVGQFATPANGGTPNQFWSDFSYDYLDSHPCSVDALERLFGTGLPGLLANTDCGPLLNPGVEFAKGWAQQAINHKVPLLIYDFRASVPDVAVIQAMGEVIP